MIVQSVIGNGDCTCDTLQRGWWETMEWRNGVYQACGGGGEMAVTAGERSCGLVDVEGKGAQLLWDCRRMAVLILERNVILHLTPAQRL